MGYLLGVVGVLLLDQLSKWAVLERLSWYESVPVVRGVFYLTLWRNSGGAFGLLQGQGGWLAWVATAVSVGVLVMLWRHRSLSRARTLNLGLVFIAGGALGNLIDRLRWGYVVDFLDFRIWPVFNLADSAIVVGTALVLLELFRRARA